jgi:NADH-quinone oxidoreductase subunit C
MPDATGLELIAQELREHVPDSVADTHYYRDIATLIVSADHVLEALRWLRAEPTQRYAFLASLHAADYLPAEPRFGVHYQLLSMERTDRLNVRTRLTGEEPHLPTVIDLFPTADFQEREVYDMFGVVFDGHPDMRRILLPEDYTGYPQRRDFPMGGEPVLFTFNEHKYPRWYD